MNRLIGISLIICFFWACSIDDQADEKFFSKQTPIDALESFNVKYYFSDSAHVKAELITPHVIEQKDTVEGRLEVVHFFDQSVQVNFYNETDQLESTVKADSGVFRKDYGLAEMYGNVVANNLVNSQVIKSEQMFWDNRKDSVYTYKPVTIVSPTDSIYGAFGFRSNTQFSIYTIFRVQGKVKLESGE